MKEASDQNDQDFKQFRGVIEGFLIMAKKLPPESRLPIKMGALYKLLSDESLLICLGALESVKMKIMEDFKTPTNQNPTKKKNYKLDFLYS